MAITKLLSTAVGGYYSFLNEMQERASSITYDQILSNIFLNGYNETELYRLYVHLRSYKERFFVEKYELVNFASTFNPIGIIMLEKEMNAYRFGTGQEPTDAMLEQIMKEVAQEARESSKKAADAHFEQMRRNIAVKREKWAEQINRIVNA